MELLAACTVLRKDPELRFVLGGQKKPALLGVK